MKVRSLLLVAGLVGLTDAAASGSLRGDKKHPDNGSLMSHYGGVNFGDSPWGGQNPWVKGKPNHILGDLDPTAPFDAVDKNAVQSWSGSAEHTGYTRPDFVPPHLHPKPFPQETRSQTTDGVELPIEQRTVVSKMDRMRVPGATNLNPLNPNPLEGYPLVAPADKINPGPYAVAHPDKVSQQFEKFFSQSAQREDARMRQKQLADAAKADQRTNADTDLAPHVKLAEIKKPVMPIGEGAYQNPKAVMQRTTDKDTNCEDGKWHDCYKVRGDYVDHKDVNHKTAVVKSGAAPVATSIVLFLAIGLATIQ